MKVTINGKPFTFEGEMTVAQILERLDIEQTAACAVALNLAVIPRADLARTRITDGDELEIIRATSGG